MNSKIKIGKLKSVLVAASFLSAGSSALADIALEEVVVTARKVTESI